MRSEPAGAVQILVEDPELGRHLPPRAAERARRLAVARVRVLEPGYWDPASDPSVGASHFGLLVLDGMLSRRVIVARRRSAELLGRGDLVRPSQPDCDAYDGVAQKATWRVLAPVRLAVLDDNLIGGLAGCPGVLGELAGRAIRRTRSLSLLLAVAQNPDLAQRLHVILWHLADRWGRRGAEGVIVDMPLSQETLGHLAAAHRTSVTEALKTLEARGFMARGGRGHFLLLGSPPSQDAEVA